LRNLKLRNKLLALSLFTLLLPWSGWKLVQELERFLRDAHESKLLSQALVLSRSIPLRYQSQLLYAPDLTLPVRQLTAAPILDGYSDDWPEADQGLVLSSTDGHLSARLLAGAHAAQHYLFIDVTDATPARSRSGVSGQDDGPQSRSDGVLLFVRSARGLQQYRIHSEAPGPLQLQVGTGGDGQAPGYWMDDEKGYRIELSLPGPMSSADLSVGIFDVSPEANETSVRTAGTLRNDLPERWISMQPQWQGLSEWLAGSSSGESQIWLVDEEGWVLADSGRAMPDQAPSAGASPSNGEKATWAQRLLYRLVAGSRTEILAEPPAWRIRIDDTAVSGALQGRESIRWAQDLSTAMVRNTAAVPVQIDGRIRGAIVVQSATDGLLLVTNRALGRLLFTTLALTVGLAAGLWYFASRLSRRVRRLSTAVSEAMQDDGVNDSLPLVRDGDELGDLARNNQKLLRAVAEYNQYLQTLAGKLSHELKTPLAITRSSLENLSTQTLDEPSRRFLERAREGLDRQAAIVRAMSEANRLEQAIRGAEWEDSDLAELVRQCVEGYRTINPQRAIGMTTPPGPVMARCAPDLIAQALDKLVDNAISLTAEEENISIDLESGDDEFLLSVRNTGTRLPQEYQDRLFDSLVSLRDKRGQVPHLGLGLYIVRLVALAHGGRVSASNLPGGGGVSFTIALPANTI
jgi:dedicated sortase system histidine kinase